MQQFVINGGNPLNGEMTPGGNKNSILKMIPACLLTDEPVTLHNAPQILDVEVTLDLMRALGATVEWIAPKTLRIHAENIKNGIPPRELAQKTRASFVFAGPLLGRCHHAELPVPGGDVIGERRLDTHIIALQKLGVDIQYHHGTFTLHAPEMHGANILLPEASVTATENIIMAAVLAKGTTILRNAASEPHVQDLCHMLVAMGAQIDGIGSNQLIIQGVDKLHGTEARVGADFMEVGSYIGAAAVTGGSIRIRDADPQHLEMTRMVFARLGVEWEQEDNDIIVPPNQRLTIQPDIGGRIPVIKAQPWPAFPPDLMSIALMIATQSAGAVMFHDWMYESRFFFTDKLVRMGARITLCDPHRVLVQGPTALKGSPNISSPDIRAGMALLLAALTAKGETRISNIGQIDRGYEQVEIKLKALGADIRRISNDLDTVEVQQIHELKA
ncbi:MAG: UDP-N-acetylglucosamine 1-carboxyvinyltransferase [Phototrophicales bacterium]|nr:MAG: UDP-N-acetylglucosamine 1-carboxyvinyltransferase [Phototrophicales bacterium]RMG72547.1 MAG: UDP-N-acetylglucosamine 1-carboxyvinyltransferase [Chloroflexota bacterium]